MLCIKVLAALGLAAALQPPKRTPVRRTNLSASPDAVAIDEGRVVGEGSYGVVVAASDQDEKQYVAKRARKDDRSKRYFEIERTINEKLRGTPGLAPYRGVVEGPTALLGYSLDGRLRPRLRRIRQAGLPLADIATLAQCPEAQFEKRLQGRLARA